MNKLLILSWGRSGSQLVAYTINPPGEFPRRIHRGEPFVREPGNVFADLTLDEICDRIVWRDSLADVAECVSCVLNGYQATEETWKALAMVADLRVIIMERNPFSRMVSQLIATRDRNWVRFADNVADQIAPAVDLTEIEVDPDLLFSEARRQLAGYKRFRQFANGRPYRVVRYEDLADDWDIETAGICDWLGLERLVDRPPLVKQITRPLDDLVSNFDQVAESCRGLWWFRQWEEDNKARRAIADLAARSATTEAKPDDPTD